MYPCSALFRLVLNPTDYIANSDTGEALNGVLELEQSSLESQLVQGVLHLDPDLNPHWLLERLALRQLRMPDIMESIGRAVSALFPNDHPVTFAAFGFDLDWVRSHMIADGAGYLPCHTGRHLLRLSAALSKVALTRIRSNPAVYELNPGLCVVQRPKLMVVRASCG